MTGIIIVAYNSRKYLDACLSSIFASSFHHFKVIIVDNNSTDGSAKYIKKNYPQAILVEQEENLGFAAGNNVGIKKAFELGCDFLLLLNPDTAIAKNCLEKLIAKADSKTVLQPLILLSENGRKTDLVNTSGNVLNFLGYSYCGGYQQNASKFNNIKDISLGSGAGSFIPAKIINKIGMFDEYFFTYHEDADLFWRIRTAGFNIRLIPDAKIWHDYSYSRNPDKMFYFERNRLIFLFKNFSPLYLTLVAPIFIINEMLVLFYSALTGRLILKVKADRDFLHWLRNQKKKNRSGIKLRLGNLKRFIRSEIHFAEMDNPLFLPYNALLFLYWGIIYIFV